MDEVAEAIEKYQGLVPLVYDIETMGLEEARPQDMYYAVYLKREADKVIANLEESHKMEVEQLLIEIAELKKEKEYVIEHTAEVINGQERELSRHKYKRCLAMVEMCNARYDEEDAKVNGCGASWEYKSKEMKYWERWRWRWDVLGERIKDLIDNG